VYLVDLLGMGRSSRPDFNYDNFEDCKNFFVDSFEKWRSKMNLTNFILVGHSFGGYISSLYAQDHYMHLKKLILLSPHGVVVKDEGSKRLF
jgi:abhydrolase domain-containing protein 5